MAPRKTHFNVAKYFHFTEDNCVKCKTCNRILNTDRTFNLKKHLLQVHKISLSKKNDFTSVALPIRRLPKTMKRVNVKINKKELIRSYIGLVTDDLVSFDVLDSQNMKNIIDPICDGLREKRGGKFSLNGRKCENVLQSVTANIKNDIKQDLQDRLLSVKIDRAMGLSRRIFGLSVQFIAGAEIQSRILGMIELDGDGGGGVTASNSVNLVIEILAILERYEIQLSQIVSITSDNGATAMKTCHCSSEDSECDVEGDENNSEYLKKIDNFELEEELYLGDLQICRAAALIAPLCALDVTKKPEIRKYLLECRNMVKYIRDPSNGYRQIFESKNLNLPSLDCPTQWGSTYEMLQRLYKAKDILINIEAVKNRSQDENFEANLLLWDFIESCSIILRPLQKIIVKLQEEQLHFGNFYALWLTCKLTTNKILSTLPDNKNTISFKIAQTLMDSIEGRTEKLLSQASFNACLYLDPRFNFMLSDLQRQDAINYLKNLWQKLIALNPKALQSLNSLDVASAPKSEENDDFDILENFLSTSLAPKSEAPDVSTKIEQLILPFTTANTNVLNFWKDRQSRDPELYALSKICFAIPPNQLTLEKTFPSLMLILNGHRNRLSLETLENILLIKLNPAHLDLAMQTTALFEDDDV